MVMRRAVVSHVALHAYLIIHLFVVPYGIASPTKAVRRMLNCGQKQAVRGDVDRGAIALRRPDDD